MAPLRRRCDHRNRAGHHPPYAVAIHVSNEPSMTHDRFANILSLDFPTRFLSHKQLHFTTSQLEDSNVKAVGGREYQDIERKCRQWLLRNTFERELTYATRECLTRTTSIRQSGLEVHRSAPHLTTAPPLEPCIAIQHKRGSCLLSQTLLLACPAFHYIGTYCCVFTLIPVFSSTLHFNFQDGQEEGPRKLRC